jgi:hypothetical protein
MTDKETAAEIRRRLAEPCGIFGWVTDGCGYDQHIKFVQHRNAHWTEERAAQQSFDAFCLEYADRLESGVTEG